MVLEFLGSSVDLSLAGPIAPDGSIAAYAERYGADPGRYGPAGRAGARRASATPSRPGITTRPPGDAAAATVAQPMKVDNDLYVRDYSKCILCYKCVEACGDGRPEHVRDRGRRARASTPGSRPSGDVPLPDSACVYCGNCIGVCPTGALMFKSEHDMREAGTWDEAAQTVTDTICPYCGVGCALDAPRPGQPDREGHLADRLLASPTATCASRAASASSSSTTGRRGRSRPADLAGSAGCQAPSPLRGL